MYGSLLIKGWTSHVAFYHCYCYRVLSYLICLRSLRFTCKRLPAMRPSSSSIATACDGLDQQNGLRITWTDELSTRQYKNTPVVNRFLLLLYNPQSLLTSCHLQEQRTVKLWDNNKKPKAFADGKGFFFLLQPKRLFNWLAKKVKKKKKKDRYLNQTQKKLSAVVRIVSFEISSLLWIFDKHFFHLILLFVYAG